VSRPRDLIEEEDVETVRQAAGRIGVSVKTVYSWIYGGKLMPYATVRRRLLLVCGEVDDCADSLRSHRNVRNRQARAAYFTASKC
jgi:predicted site-specific integrase-resolvase